MKRLRVGVIGVGAMGKHHVRIYSGMRGVELVGVADINEKTTEEVATEYHTEAFTDCENLLKRDLDAVVSQSQQAFTKTLHLKQQTTACICLSRSQ